MTRSVVREPDQDNQSDVPVQGCFVPGDTSKLAKNMDSGINGITTRYGRAVKIVHSAEDVTAKSIKTPKTPPVTVPPAPALVDAGRSESSTIPETPKTQKLKPEGPEKKANVVKQQSPPDTPESEVPDSREFMLDDMNGDSRDDDKPSNDSRWGVGELAWAHVSNYPYWPCIVTVDLTDDTHLKRKPFGQRIIKMVHVTYFGDNGRHNWVNENSLMKFEGLKQFNDLAMELLKGRKKCTKFYAGFVVKTVIKQKWDTAVSEAEVLLPMEITDRLRAIAPKRKRGRPRLSHESAAKRPRLDEFLIRKSIDEDLETIKSRTKSFDDTNLTTETPPTPPSSIKDSSDESSTVRKYKRRRRTKAETNEDFENYYNVHKDDKGYVPDGSQEEIRQYLQTIWDGMSVYFRSKYKAGSNDLHTKEKSSSPNGETTHEESTPRTRKSKGSKDQSKEQSKEKMDIILDPVKRPKLMNLFKGVKAERVCQICEKTGNLTRCKGPCYSYFHLKCVKPGESESEGEGEEDTVDSASTGSGEPQKKSKDDSLEEENFKCIDCLSGVAPACFICNEREDERIRCTVATCGRHYHSKCLTMWPQSHWHGGRLTCPYHMCHTCISDNPQNHHTRITNDKLARCVRCPSAYHASVQCLPAGSQILTSTQVICPKHYVAPHPPLNAAWCFLCTRGGSLICCDTCPTSFHPECLGIDAPDGAFICEDCETGRLPLYGEVVWVKLGNYRWWPSRICYPQEIPSNLTAVSHSPGEFCVMFLGTKNYYWVHRGRVFLYQEGDTCARNSMGRKTVDDAYKQAVVEANELHQQVKNERVAAKEDESKNLRPPPYVKIRVNKPVGNVKPMEMEVDVACECDGKWEHPCSPDSDCLNRILSIECNPTICPAGAKCNNQSFVRRKYPLMEPFHTAGRGWGLKTLEAIKSGQFVIEYVGEVIDEAEYKRRLHRKKELRNENYYFLTIDNYRTIDAEPKGNLSRFMNHSCQPNCETQKWTVNGDTRIGLFALKDIEKGEELTFNYNLATEGETKKPCLCGASNCSGYIGLKAQKPQSSPVEQVAQEFKAEPEKVKKQRRSKKIYKCWKCGHVISGDNFVECGMKSCHKRYHAKCLKKNYVRRLRCPWHHCADCQKRTSVRCLSCSTAYCQNHLEGKMIEKKDKNGYLCKRHKNSMGENERESLGDATGESENPDDNSEVNSRETEATGGSLRSHAITTHLMSQESERSRRKEAKKEDVKEEKADVEEEKENVKEEKEDVKVEKEEKTTEKRPQKPEDPLVAEHKNLKADETIPADKSAEMTKDKPVENRKSKSESDVSNSQVIEVEEGGGNNDKVEIKDEVQEIEMKKQETHDVVEVDDDILSITETKVDSDEDFDTASLLADSDGSINGEDVFPPRVSIIEIDLSDEDDRDEEIDIKPEDEDIDGMDVKEEDIVPASVKRRRTLRNHQMHRIVGRAVRS
ncbi:histone-lysine N-methyltransferase NSD2 isoform X2 [Diachasmimorpha longicaudata]|uniref:histone-lysine N-methyltransferase NSD2 isoform X2 n=1 Tax=Diachasmimorpha longicaudata TaxID=58733 RepID=UPI0030B87178